MAQPAKKISYKNEILSIKDGNLYYGSKSIAKFKTPLKDPFMMINNDSTALLVFNYTDSTVIVFILPSFNLQLLSTQKFCTLPSFTVNISSKLSAISWNPLSSSIFSVLSGNSIQTFSISADSTTLLSNINLSSLYSSSNSNSNLNSFSYSDIPEFISFTFSCSGFALFLLDSDSEVYSLFPFLPSHSQLFPSKITLKSLLLDTTTYNYISPSTRNRKISLLFSNLYRSLSKSNSSITLPKNLESILPTELSPPINILPYPDNLYALPSPSSIYNISSPNLSSHSSLVCLLIAYSTDTPTLNIIVSSHAWCPKKFALIESISLPEPNFNIYPSFYSSNIRNSGSSFKSNNLGYDSIYVVSKNYVIFLDFNSWLDELSTAFNQADDFFALSVSLKPTFKKRLYENKNSKTQIDHSNALIKINLLSKEETISVPLINTSTNAIGNETKILDILNPTIVSSSASQLKINLSNSIAKSPLSSKTRPILSSKPGDITENIEKGNLISNTLPSLHTSILSMDAYKNVKTNRVPVSCTSVAAHISGIYDNNSPPPFSLSTTPLVVSESTALYLAKVVDYLITNYSENIWVLVSALHSKMCSQREELRRQIDKLRKIILEDKEKSEQTDQVNKNVDSLLNRQEKINSKAKKLVEKLGLIPLSTDSSTPSTKISLPLSESEKKFIKEISQIQNKTMVIAKRLHQVDQDTEELKEFIRKSNSLSITTNQKVYKNSASSTSGLNSNKTDATDLLSVDNIRERAIPGLDLEAAEELNENLSSEASLIMRTRLKVLDLLSEFSDL